jgi:hypothetical protein
MKIRDHEVTNLAANDLRTDRFDDAHTAVAHDDGLGSSGVLSLSDAARQQHLVNVGVAGLGRLGADENLTASKSTDGELLN